jgi:YesN/AraC family two-component response regulator
LGIPADEIEKIFEPFYQARIQQIRKYEGTGIGLSLVKNMVQLHHGELFVKSSTKDNHKPADDYTTCFKLKLPLENSLFQPEEILLNDANEEVKTKIPTFLEEDEINEFAEPIQQVEIENISNRQRPVVLVVEDNDDLKQFIFESLQDQYVFLLAKNGVEGFNIAIEHLPDLIVSDIMMPLMTGTEMCHNLKNDQRTSHIPIILLTARTADEHKIEGYESGADDYVSKPFNMVLLSARIKNLIEIRISLRKSFRKEIFIKPTDKLVTPVDADFLEHVLAVIEKNMDNSNFDVETLSKEIGLSSRHLLNKLQNLTDYSPVELIRTLRLKRAEQLLLQKKATIAEIAYEVGFSDPNYFSKCFAKQYGKTPREYIEAKRQ